MSWLGAMLGIEPETRLLVGIEDDPGAPGGLVLYVGARYTGIHTHVPPEGAEEVRRGYSSAHHVFAHISQDVLCDCDPAAEVTP